MTMRERILAVYKGETPDVVPYMLDLSHYFYHKHHKPWDLSKSYDEPEYDLIDYHKKMGVSVVPYQKDQNGYNQLYEVIKDWNSRINQTSQSLYDTYKEIENIVEDYGTRPS